MGLYAQGFPSVRRSGGVGQNALHVLSRFITLASDFCRQRVFSSCTSYLHMTYEATRTVDRGGSSQEYISPPFVL